MGQRIGVVIKLVDIKGARRFIGKAAGIILEPGQRRDKIFADPFDQPGSRFAVASGIDLIGKDGTRRIGENKFRFGECSANQA